MTRREERDSDISGFVTINEKSYILENWSSMGFSALGFDQDLKKQDRIDIKISLKSTDNEFEFTCQSILVRVDLQKQVVAGAFVKIPSETRKRISDHFTPKSSLQTTLARLKRVFTLPFTPKAN